MVEMEAMLVTMALFLAARVLKERREVPAVMVEMAEAGDNGDDVDSGRNGGNDGNARGGKGRDGGKRGDVYGRSSVAVVRR
jgi:hypothetical protein